MLLEINNEVMTMSLKPNRVWMFLKAEAKTLAADGNSVVRTAEPMTQTLVFVSALDDVTSESWVQNNLGDCFCQVESGGGGLADVTRKLHISGNPAMK